MFVSNIDCECSSTLLPLTNGQYIMGTSNRTTEPANSSFKVDAKHHVHFEKLICEQSSI